MKQKLLSLTLSVICFLAMQNAWADDTGWVKPSSYSSYNPNITDPGNLLSCDGSSAVIGDGSGFYLDGFSFSIPSNAIINGIEIKIKGHAIRFDKVLLYNLRFDVGDNEYHYPAFSGHFESSTEETKILGNPWLIGDNWSAADFGPNFRVKLDAYVINDPDRNDPVYMSMDCLEVRVTYNCIAPVVSSVTASTSIICSGENVTLSVTGDLGSASLWYWYTGGCGSPWNPFAYGPTIVVSPTHTTTYNVNGQGGCLGPVDCSSVTVTVVKPPIDPTSATATPATICSGETSKLKISGGGYGTSQVVKWYTGSCGGTYIGNGSYSGLQVNPTSTTTYYGRYEVDVPPCSYVSACVEVTVTVNQKPADPTSATAVPTAICSGQSSTLTLNGGGGGTSDVITWYTGSCGGTPAGTGNNLGVSPTSTTTYYGRYEGGCTTQSLCASVTIIVYPPSVGGTIAGTQPICSGEKPADLSLSEFTGNVVKWQKSVNADFASSVDIDETNATLTGATIGALTENTYFRAKVKSGVCDPINSSPVMIIVYALPEAPEAGDISTNYDGKIHEGTASSAEGLTVVWYDAVGEPTVAPSGTNVGTYTAWAESVNITTGCKSATRTQVTVTIKPAPLTIKANDATKYCGEMNPVFSVAYNGFVNGENESVLSGTLSISSTANEDSGAGTYPITPSGLTSANYEITFEPGVLTINSVSIDASASSNPVLVGSPSITLSATVLDASSNPVSNMKVLFSIENGNNKPTNYPAVFTDGSGIATLTLNGLASTVDVFKVTAVAGSGCGSDATSIAYLAVYDPNGGFVTGGGWINSPAGAYLVDPLLTGKANFGFVSKYKKGSNIPDGNTEFQFGEGNLNFSISSYKLGSLVIAGYKAIYKGVGTINGVGNYGFMVSAVDGNVADGGGYDKFRIKIWNIIDDAIVYDNNLGEDENDVPTTVLGGGSIVIHKADAKTPKSMQMAEFGLKVYPNPFTDHIYFDLQLKTDSKVRLEIFNIDGSKVATIYNDVVVAYDHYQLEYTPKNVSNGMLFYRLTVDGQLMFSSKLIHY